MVLTTSDSTLQKGMSAPSFSLKGTDEKTHSLADFSGNCVLIVFMCNHCPYVKPKIEELNRLAVHFKDSVKVIGINSNESEHYPEDSFEQMKRLVNQGDIKFLYVHDESQEVAKAYGAVCTPDPFFFDAQHKLVWAGRIDDSHGSSPASRHELFDAIDEFLRAGTISLEEQPSMGCSIKWK